MLRRTLLLYHTVKYLKVKQVFYRLYYAARAFSGRHKKFTELIDISGIPKSYHLQLTQSIAAASSYSKDHSFTFLNISHDFIGDIDWNWGGHGKLWNYNLNYFDYLLQPDLTQEKGMTLMMDFVGHYGAIQDGKEAYPTSLRIMNWIKFMSIHQIKNRQLDQVIFTDLKRLQCNIEYHLMGNHLLKNAFALLFGAFYFRDVALFRQMEGIMKRQVKEQILSDGAHFELTPMYHQIILARILDCINIFSNNDFQASSSLFPLLITKGQQALQWLQNMVFRNGDVPHVNDSTFDIAPDVESIAAYAKRLSLEPANVSLNESGYRKYVTDSYEVLIDVGDIGPDYIPGHSHSDTLNFILYHRENPVIVDTGISTYEEGETRLSERSTTSHNTVTINGQEQSRMWKAFRVAQRAKIGLIKEDQKGITASHNGYDDLGVNHERSYFFYENKIEIIDRLSKKAEGKAFLHFHPDVSIALKENSIERDFGKILIEGSESIENKKYKYALGFNKTREAIVAEIAFKQHLKITILLK